MIERGLVPPPEFEPLASPGRGQKQRSLSFGIIVVGLNIGAYGAEIVRGALDAVPKEQREGAIALSFGRWQQLRMVLLPQAVRAMMPVIIAQLVVTLKDTALGFIITYPELLYFARLLGSNAVLGSPLIPAALIAGTIYVILCLALSFVAYSVEKRLRRSPRTVQVAHADDVALEGATDTELIALRRGLGKHDSTSGG